MTILITGVAGFIGSHLASKMLSQNFNVLGIDNLNNYYSVNLKKYRLKQLKKFKNFHKAIALAGDILSQSELSIQDIEYANVFFAEAADQLLYNYNPIEVDADGNVSGGELKGPTKYHQDLRSSERPQRNASKIKKGTK